MAAGGGGGEGLEAGDRVLEEGTDAPHLDFQKSWSYTMKYITEKKTIQDKLIWHMSSADVMIPLKQKFNLAAVTQLSAIV